MEVHTVTVSFERSRQPREYETARAQVGYTAALETGEDYETATAELIDGARRIVYERLGLSAPEPAAKAAEKSTAEEKPAKRKRRTKAEIEADKAKETAGEDKSETPSDDKSEASSSSDDTLPGFDDDETPAETVSDAELQRAATAAAKKVGAEKVKELIKEFGVARSAEIPPGKRAAFVEKLEGLG